MSRLYRMLVLLWLVPLYGQQAFLYPVQQLDSQQAPPTYAEISQPIALDSAQLDGIHRGAYLSLQISERRQIQLQVVTLDRYVNGDRVIAAEGRDDDRFFSLTITQGQRSLFGHLSSDDETFQTIRDRECRHAHTIRVGSISQAVSLGIEQGFQNDYILIDKPSSVMRCTKPQPEIISILPMQIDDVSSQSSPADAGPGPIPQR